MKLSGIAAAPGLAVGPVFAYRPKRTVPDTESIPEGCVPEELSLFEAAAERLAGSLEADAQRLREEGRKEVADVLEAHAEMARDPELSEAVGERVRGLKSARAAVLEAGEELAGLFREMEDEYMRARAEDVVDVARQLAAEVLGEEDVGLEGLDGPAVILAHSLAPSETARLGEGLALGFVTAAGSRTSHVSIMARARGIPAVVGVGYPDLEASFGSKTVAVDGNAGHVRTDPDAETVALFKERAGARGRRKEDLERYRHVEARTRGGARIEVFANLGSDAEAEAALDWGAEGVGLLRTEFLFMERDELPSEEEQYAGYASVARAFGGRPVTIRTLDIGGDKPLPSVERSFEENPFLGWRGVRMSLETPGLFRPQLRAILRAAAEGEVRMMFPMVADARELVRAKELLNECREELAAERVPFGTVAVGAMVEVPAAALCAAEIAREADFLSIGTNDLTQYVLAADRGNARLAPYLRDAGHPAVMTLVRLVCEAARDGGIPVGVCGEAAGDPKVMPGLVAAGVTELSVAPPLVPEIKRLVGEL